MKQSTVIRRIKQAGRSAAASGEEANTGLKERHERI
jgi:hypothetical protein